MKNESFQIMMNLPEMFFEKRTLLKKGTILKKMLLGKYQNILKKFFLNYWGFFRLNFEKKRNFEWFEILKRWKFRNDENSGKMKF